MLVTSLDLSFIRALIQWDRHCQKCNFRHAVNYSFEFCGAQRLNGYMGSVPYASYHSSGQQNRRWYHLKIKWRDDSLWRTGQWEPWSLPALHKYLMNCFERGRLNLRVSVIQSRGWWVSTMPLMLPHCLSTDKESLQTHQQHQVEATRPHINHSRQRNHTDKYCLQLTGSMSSFSTVFVFCFHFHKAAFATLWIIIWKEMYGLWGGALI